MYKERTLFNQNLDMSKKKFINEVADWVKKKGYKRIRANNESYETPIEYTSTEKDKTYTPDVTGILRGRKSYFEIALKTDNKQRRITKWKLLSTLAKLKGGKLFLLAPRGHKAFAQRIIKKYNLEAQLVPLHVS